MVSEYLVDKHGQPLLLPEQRIADLDPGFFLPAGAGGLSLMDVTTQPGKYHAWTYACARAIAYNISRLRRGLRNIASGEEVENHPVLDLLMRPNTMQTEMTFFQSIVMLLLLIDGQAQRSQSGRKGGQVFIVPWKVREERPAELGKGEVPDELIPFSDRFFEPWLEKGAKGMQRPIGWKLEIPGRQTVAMEFRVDQIIRIVLPNPYSILSGLSPQLSAQLAIDQDARADLYNLKLYDNDARVSGVLTTDQYVDDRTGRQYSRMWQQKYGGTGNVGKTAVIGNGLKYQQLGLAQADMQWIEGKKWDKDQILAAFGCNDITIGAITNINRATLLEGRRLLWQDTYLPIDKLIWDALNNSWIRYIEGGRYRGFSDASEIEALREDFTARSVAAGNMVQKMDFPPELASRIVGIKLTQEDLARWPHLSEPPQKASPFGSPPADAKAVQRVPTEVVTLGVDEKEQATDEYIEAILEKGINPFARDMERFFVKQRNTMQDNVDAWLDQQKSVRFITAERLAELGLSKAAFVKPDEIMFDVDDETQKLLDIYKPHVADQMNRELVQLRKELGQVIDWNVTDERVVAMVGQRRSFLQGINTLTFEDVREDVVDTISQGLEENLTPQEMAKALKKTIGSSMKGRISNVRTIARTEMGTVAASARFQAFQVEGVEKHQWSTSRDEKVRREDGMGPNHEQLEGVIVNVGEVFIRKDGINTNMRFPRDQSGAAGDVINCRCVNLAVFKK